MPKWYIKLFTGYALVLFALLLVIALFFYALVKIAVPYQDQIRWVYRINKAIMLVWVPLTGFRFKISGAENADPSNTYIVVANHQNLLDMFTIARHLKIPGKPLVKRELLSIPLLGWLFRMSSLAVTREVKESRNASFQVMVKEVKKGISVLIFPEGTRNRTLEPLLDFKDGAFKLAVETNTPILPVLIMHTRAMGGERPIFLKPGTIYLDYGKPVDPARFEGDIQALKQYCKTVMEQTLIEKDPFFKTN